MSKEIEFFVDDKRLSTLKSELTLADILSLVGVPSDQFFLVSQDGTEYKEQDETIEINFGDHFKTRKYEREDPLSAPDTIHYKVNGEEQTTQKDSLTVREILQNAGEAASIDLSQINSYFLENVETGRKYENADDRVDLKEGDQFLAIHVGSTPVA